MKKLLIFLVISFIAMSSFTGCIFGFQSGKIIIATDNEVAVEGKFTLENSSLSIADKDGKAVDEIIFPANKKETAEYTISWFGYEQEMSTKIKVKYSSEGQDFTAKSGKSATIKAGLEVQKINISDLDLTKE